MDMIGAADALFDWAARIVAIDGNATGTRRRADGNGIGTDDVRVDCAVLAQ